MKRLVVAAGILICWVGLGGLAQAQEQVASKIGIINTKEIFDAHPQAQKAQKILIKEFQQRQEEIRNQEKGITKLKKQLEENPLLSEEEREKQEILIKTKIEDLLDYKDKAEEYLGKREEELTKSIIKEIYQIIKDTAKEKKLDMVLEGKPEIIVYRLDELDITDDVVERLKNKIAMEESKKANETKPGQK